MASVTINIPPARRLALESFESMFGIGCLVVGLLITVGHPELRISAAQTLPDPLVYLWSVMLWAGGLLITLASLWPRSPRGFEPAGLSLAGSAWTVYLVMLLNATSPVPNISYLIGSGFILACFLRLLATWGRR